MISLKPCPLCGDLPKVRTNRGILSQVYCPKCGARTPMIDSHRKLVNRWNRRDNDRPIKPCPLCRSKAHEYSMEVCGDLENCNFIQCTECGFIIGGQASPEEVRSAWNRRVSND